MKETILLTGATGFLGSRLLHKLCDSNLYRIIVLKRTFSNTIRISDILDNRHEVEYIDVDTVETDFFEEYFSKNTVDIIIHCATYYGRGSNSSITRVLESNMMFPLSLLEVAVKHGLKLFINTDSYFNKQNQTYHTLLDYSLSKKTLNLWLEYLSSKVKIANFRLEHIYGENDSPTKFVESMIRKIAIENVESIALTYGQQMRDFIYIDDVCDAYLSLLKKYKKFDFRYLTFETGTGVKCSIRNFVERIKDISGSSTELLFGELPYREDEIMCSYADTSFLNNLGWKAQVGVDSGIKKIIDFYRKNGVVMNSDISNVDRLNKITKKQPLISLCIPSSGRVRFLEKTLDSIYAQKTDSSFFEVCISDNSDNSETKELLESKYSNKDNLVYKKSSEHSYLNLIDALKMGSGTYLKLLNDYTSFKDIQTLNNMIHFVSQYKDTNVILFFKSQKKDCEIVECNDFNSFLKSVSYINTSAPCFGIYRNEFMKITESGIPVNKWFPHVSLLYNQDASHFVVVDKTLYETPRIKKKGGYNLPMVFGKEYIQMNEKLLKAGRIKQDTFDFLRLETLDFISDWYSMSKHDKKHCAFDFTDTEKWLSCYYTEDEIQCFYKMLKKHNISRIFRKVFYLPLLVGQKGRKVIDLIVHGGGYKECGEQTELALHFTDTLKDAA